VVLFNSAQYALFLVVVFFGFWGMARYRLLRTVFLLGASYYFYAHWNWRYLGLIFLSSTVDYLVGRGLAVKDDPSRRKQLLLCSIVFNLGVLCAFKYFNFFSDSLGSLAGYLGIELAPMQLRVLLPVGISFYTFQSMSYTIDVYRRRLEPETSFVRYLLFVSLFPQLVAGPIVRASHFLPQLAAKPLLPPSMGSRGIMLILIGLLKKVAIADYLAVNIVDRVFDFPERFSTFEVLAGIYGYALQIYCDFSGYSDIAIGSALLLGLRIPENFDRPYLAVNLRDFWRRWHISLSTWLRDYLYIPLGGSKHGALRTYGALMATMVLGGLWHGAAWTFVLWGALHGVALAGTRAFQRAVPEGLPNWTRPISMFLTFHFVCLGWILFRSPSLDRVHLLLRQVFVGDLGIRNLPIPVVLALCLGFATHLIPRDIVDRLIRAFAGLPPVLQAAVALLVIAVVHLIDVSDVQPFIYFQF